MKNKRIKQGFTLIELLVVVLIIGILASVALPQYQLAVDKSKYTTLMPLVRAIKNAEEAYYLENNEYASNLEQLDIATPWGGNCSAKGDMCIQFNESPAQVFGRIKLSSASTEYDNAFLVFLDKSGAYGRQTCFAYTGARSERLCKAISGKSTLQTDCGGNCKIVNF